MQTQLQSSSSRVARKAHPPRDWAMKTTVPQVRQVTRYWLVSKLATGRTRANPLTETSGAGPPMRMLYLLPHVLALCFLHTRSCTESAPDTSSFIAPDQMNGRNDDPTPTRFVGRRSPLSSPREFRRQTVKLSIRSTGGTSQAAFVDSVGPCRLNRCLRLYEVNRQRWFDGVWASSI